MRERRKIRNRDGRRVGERRALVLAVAPPGGMPEWLGRYADRVRFLERVESNERQRETVEADRWVIRFQAGDATAFELLYGHFHGLVHSYMEAALGDRDEAEETTQEVFGRVARSLPGYELRGVPFRVWLIRVMRNQLINHLEKHGRAEVEPWEPARLDRHREGVSWSAELDLQRPLDDEVVLQALQRLAPTQRRVILLRHMLGLGVEEIAELLDTTPHAIRNIQYRAFVFLRARLAPTRQNPGRIDRAGWLRRKDQMLVLRTRRFSMMNTS